MSLKLEIEGETVNIISDSGLSLHPTYSVYSVSLVS